MSEQDRLYELLPVVLRQRDAEQGYPLRGLLRVIGAQADEVEKDISQLYENWFIETCQDWVVPYIGDLVGYQPVHEAGEPGEVTTPQGLQRNKILFPRREVANAIRYRRRKGTLSLLEQICQDVSGWPSRSVEFYKLLCLFQPINHLKLQDGRTAGSVDLHGSRALSLLDGPFDQLAHTIDIRDPASRRGSGRYNIPGIGLFVCRLKPYSVSKTRARNLERHDPLRYTFSILGNETPLYNLPIQETDPSHIAEERNLPIPITIQALEDDIRKHDGEAYYGPDKSLQIWVLPRERDASWRLVPPGDLVIQSLKGWKYKLDPGKIAVDPERGLMAFPPGGPAQRIKVSYHYAFSADVGGGEYEREMLEAPMQAVALFRKTDITQDMWKKLIFHAFSWNKVPGIDEDRLIDLLTTRYGADWARTAGIEKIDNGNAIRLSDDRRLLLLKWSDKESKVTLEIDGIIRDEFPARRIDSDLLVYPLPNGSASDKFESELSKYLWNEAHARVKEYLIKSNNSETIHSELDRGLQEELNRQLGNQDLYRIYSIGRPQLSAGEANDLVRKQKRLDESGERLSAAELARLNRLLLEDAYGLPLTYIVYRIGEKDQWKNINSALGDWEKKRPRYAILEITNSGTYSEEIEIKLTEGQSLQIRAANGARPVLGLFERILDLPEHLLVKGEKGSRFIMDGLLTSGLGVRIEGEMDEVIIRHSTLVPGFVLYPRGSLREQPGPSLSLFNLKVEGRVRIEHSIIGPIQVIQSDIRSDPIEIQVTDSIIDATSRKFEALHEMSGSVANAALTIKRSTVLGQVWVHAIELAEDSIFAGQVMAARSQRGCMRFCYAPAGSRTPKRFGCQPDLAELPLRAQQSGGEITMEDFDRQLEGERLRIAPQFNSTRYGTATYCQLADQCAREIREGAEDESEMGVFHDLFQPQRAANLRARLEEYTPAGMNAGIFYES
jgi:hypothetical protein